MFLPLEIGPAPVFSVQTCVIINRAVPSGVLEPINESLKTGKRSRAICSEKHGAILKLLHIELGIYVVTRLEHESSVYHNLLKLII